MQKERHFDLVNFNHVYFLLHCWLNGLMSRFRSEVRLRLLLPFVEPKLPVLQEAAVATERARLQIEGDTIRSGRNEDLQISQVGKGLMA